MPVFRMVCTRSSNRWWCWRISARCSSRRLRKLCTPCKRRRRWNWSQSRQPMSRSTTCCQRRFVAQTASRWCLSAQIGSRKRWWKQPQRPAFSRQANGLI
ncbi:hypothetical protein ADN00_12885 [Ornatilinea apprima]|uniref:Uncharacterized protein n=1 Tax=Ornatilinea apprima TaxID=1134406 RepID=A0A0P6XSC7_9CHLR|nr:hypothetical protein ADN00_12885 [Ornatilinea apprima]